MTELSELIAARRGWAVRGAVVATLVAILFYLGGSQYLAMFSAWLAAATLWSLVMTEEQITAFRPTNRLTICLLYASVPFLMDIVMNVDRHMDGWSLSRQFSGASVIRGLMNLVFFLLFLSFTFAKTRARIIFGLVALFAVAIASPPIGRASIVVSAVLTCALAVQMLRSTFAGAAPSLGKLNSIAFIACPLFMMSFILPRSLIQADSPRDPNARPLPNAGGNGSRSRRPVHRRVQFGGRW